jgi:hypothetical protein
MFLSKIFENVTSDYTPVIGPDMQLLYVLYSAHKTNTFYHYFSMCILTYSINYKICAEQFDMKHADICKYTAVTT